MMRPWIPSMIFMMDWPTTFSELVKVGISALVESESRERLLLQGLPYDGGQLVPNRCKVKLKSPVQTIFP